MTFGGLGLLRVFLVEKMPKQKAKCDGFRDYKGGSGKALQAPSPRSAIAEAVVLADWTLSTHMANLVKTLRALPVVGAACLPH